MFIDISRIGAKGLLLEDSAAMNEAMLIEEESYFVDALKYKVHLSHEQEKIRARGQLETRISLRCVGCLDNFDYTVESNFDLILFPVNLVDVGHTALKSDEMEYIFYEGDQIDLEKILMEQVNLFLPLNPRCAGSCKGICSNCGTNLNKEECHCENTFKEENQLNLFSKL